MCVCVVVCIVVTKLFEKLEIYESNVCTSNLRAVIAFRIRTSLLPAELKNSPCCGLVGEFDALYRYLTSHTYTIMPIICSTHDDSYRI